MATVAEIPTAPGALRLGQLNLLNKHSSCQTLPCSRAALEASYPWSAEMPLHSAGFGLSLQKCTAEVVKICF